MNAVFGIDFSGAQLAGRKIWLAQLRPAPEGAALVMLAQASALWPDAAARDAVLPLVRSFIAAQRGALFGLDFPISLAASMIPYPDWDTFASRFSADYPDADSLYRAGYDSSHPRRQTDYESRTPFAPTNLRLFRQTYYGIRELLAPLAAAQAAAVLPCQPDPADDRPRLLEICPASFLKARRLYFRYKGASTRARESRAAILTALEWMGLTGAAAFPALLDDAQGDGLDSLLAAFGALRAWRHEWPLAADGPLRLEGAVYGWRA